MKKDKIEVIQTLSSIGILPKHKATLIGLGLNKIMKKVVIEDTLSNRGMIKKVSYMLKIKEIK